MLLGRKISRGSVVVFVATLAYACRDSGPGSESDKDGGPGGTIGGFDTRPKDGGKAPVPCQKDPSFYETPGDGCDNDADGTIDNTPTCDATDAPDKAEAYARALGVCTKASEKGYGLVSAKITRGWQRVSAPDPAQHSLLTKFGNVIRPREGAKMVVFSTGFAQEFNGAPGETFKGVGFEDPLDDVNGLPPGFPRAAKGCDAATITHDVVVLKLTLKSPKNASGFAFDFDFYTSEWPDFICTKWNDGFIAYLTAKSFKNGAGDNISFDSRGNPVSINNGFFDRCTKGITLGCGGGGTAGISECPAGVAELGGTGYGLQNDSVCGSDKPATFGGATGWLSSQAPIAPEETFTLDFMLWDTVDNIRDSTVLLDNFRWSAGEVPSAPVTERPPDVK